MLNKLERQAADVLKNELLLRSEQELRQKLDKLDPDLSQVFCEFNFGTKNQIFKKSTVKKNFKVVNFGTKN